MDPPGNNLLSNTVTHDSAISPSLSNLNDTDDDHQSVFTGSDPLQSSASTVPVDPTPKAPPLITHIDNDDDFGPRYKDQANSVAHDGNVNNDRKRTPNVATMDVAVPTTSGKQDNGPNYKDQVNDSSNEVFLSSNHASNSNPNNSNSNNSNSAPMVPIVHGILIPPEMLTDEEGRSSGQEVTNRSPVGSDTYPRTSNTAIDVDTPNNRQNQSENVNEKKFSQSSSSKNEKIFWMEIILGAIFFNTFFVAAVIVGTFCGIGLCSSSTSSVASIASPSLSPTNIPTLVPTPPSLITALPTKGPYSNDAWLNLGPPSAAPSYVPSGAPSYVPSKTPILVVPETANSDGGTNLVAFIVPAVILEFIIVLICVYYYYQRRSKRQSKAELEPPQNEEKEKVNESLPPEDSRSVLTA